MEKRILVLCIVLIAFNGYTQIQPTPPKADGRTSLFSSQNYKKYAVVQLKGSPSQGLFLAPNALFYDSIYYRKVQLDNALSPFNSNRRYFVYDLKHNVQNPIQPYGTIRSALACGTVNYLIYLTRK